MKRREFLIRTALAAGAVAVSGSWLRAAGTRLQTFDPYGPVTLGRTKIKTSRFCLGTDYVDLVLLHCVVSPKWNEELSEQMDILAKLKGKGTIRAHGVSCHSLDALKVCVDEPWVDSVHARINLFKMSMDGALEEVVPVLREIHAAGKGVVGMKIMGESRLRHDDEKKDESVKYVLGLGCVDVLNVGCESTSEIDDVATRVRKVPVGIPFDDRRDRPLGSAGEADNSVDEPTHGFI